MNSTDKFCLRQAVPSLKNKGFHKSLKTRGSSIQSKKAEQREETMLEYKQKFKNHCKNLTASSFTKHKTIKEDIRHTLNHISAHVL